MPEPKPENNAASHLPPNLGTLFLETARRYPQKTAFLYKSRGRYRPMTWAEVLRQVGCCAGVYASAGLRTGDRVAILSENRPEWAIADLAAQCLGIATVPLYPSLTASEVRYILLDSGARAVVLSGKTQLEKIIEIQNELPDTALVIAFEEALETFRAGISKKFLLWAQFARGTMRPPLTDPRSPVKPDAPASIIYTSGTTGAPKGAVLTHANFIHNIGGCRRILRMSEREIHLSFLPLCHVFERTAGYYLMIHIGATIAYAEDMESVPRNICEVRPTFLLGVPRFYEKVRARVLEAVKNADPVRKALFFWARQIGEARRLGTRRDSVLFFIERGLAWLLVYRTFRHRLGGRLRFCFSGGAAISVDLLNFFHDLGVMIYEGYGLTETSPVICANHEGKYRFGTVGTPVPGVEVKIESDGEILTKSPSVMRGYHNLPRETAQALEGGWFHTGDLGCQDEDGFVRITGRKKELIVTSGGKKVSPGPIEQLLSADPYILRCVLFGEGKKFITAFIVPRRIELEEYARSQKIAYGSFEELLSDPGIYRFIDLRIKESMARFASYEKIKYFVFLSHDFEQSAGEMTPTLKVKRHVIYDRYQNLLLPFYSDQYSRERA